MRNLWYSLMGGRGGLLWFLHIWQGILHALQLGENGFETQPERELQLQCSLIETTDWGVREAIMYTDGVMGRRLANTQEIRGKDTKLHAPLYWAATGVEKANFRMSFVATRFKSYLCDTTAMGLEGTSRVFRANRALPTWYSEMIPVNAHLASFENLPCRRPHSFPGQAAALPQLL